MATRTAIGDLNPKAKDWMRRAIDEHARRNGRIRELVLRMLATRTPEAWTPENNGVWQSRAIRAMPARWTEPTREDLAAALLEAPGEPIPPALLDYVIKSYILETKPLKTGRKTPPRSTEQDVEIIAFYQRQQHKADRRKKAGVTSKPATRAKARTAKKFGISIRTLESIVSPLPLLKSTPK